MTNKPRARWQGLAGLLLCIPAAAWGDPPDARQLLERMARAVAESSYQGSFVYRRGENFAPFRIVHRVLPGGTVQEHVVSLEGFPGKMVRAGAEVSIELGSGWDFHLSRAQPVAPRPTIVGPMLELLEKLEDCYRLMVAGRDRIAGADAWIVSAVPRDEYRYGYRFYIDQEHYLMLGSKVVDAAGNIIEELSFISLERLPQVMDAPPPVVHDRPVAHLVEQVRPSPATVLREFGELPPGFTILSDHSRVLDIDTATVMQLVFSDGLVQVSLFIEPLGPTPLPDGVMQFAGMQAYSQTVPGYQLTAVGAVPANTLKAITAAVPALPAASLD